MLQPAFLQVLQSRMVPPVPLQRQAVPPLRQPYRRRIAAAAREALPDRKRCGKYLCLHFGSFLYFAATF
jgi:hypothetical protein